jgi:hypothetical protein
MLVFDLDKFFKGSTEVTESDAGKVLEYMKSVFEQASLTAPTTYMSPKNLSTYLKSLRNICIPRTSASRTPSASSDVRRVR